jgi:TonB family protein
MGVMSPNYRRDRFTTSMAGKLTLAFSTLALCLTTVLVPSSLAQKTPKSDRRVAVTVKPEYPELLKHAQVGGLVRLKATVLPNGTVTTVEVLGGNPILAEKAVAAVMKWKFVPAPAQTVEEVSLSFTPH